MVGAVTTVIAILVGSVIAVGSGILREFRWPVQLRVGGSRLRASF
jgi:hypothetical protein